ncbi:MAG: tRNA-dihydrouridine synthase, partial [Alphaproteobacteria bacterium]|nr:tRNA-dihydrouridine synthase [Alphaproteobacteria bacterium]
LHVVDLDAIYEDTSVNASAIESILKTVKLPMQLSGGMRSMNAIESWLDKGVERAVLASAALDDPELVREAAKRFPGHIGVKIDSIGGYVARKGWANTTSLKALDLALRVEDAGVSAIIYADINMDGALSEVDMEAIVDFAFALTVPVIASGGVHSLQDLAALKSHQAAGIEGLILGRALYTGAINASAALTIADS